MKKFKLLFVLFACFSFANAASPVEISDQSIATIPDEGLLYFTDVKGVSPDNVGYNELSVSVSGNNFIIHDGGQIRKKTESHISVYPNPVNSNSRVNIFEKGATNVNLQLRDSSGRLILSKEISLDENGKGIYAWEVIIENPILTPGIYTLSYPGDGEIVSTRVVLIK